MSDTPLPESLQFAHRTKRPEHVAEWAMRFLALFLDGLFQLIGLAVLIGIAALLRSDGVVVAAVVGGLVVVFLYGPLLLTFNHGQTWGKQLVHVRVVTTEGRPVGFGRAFARELLLKAIPSLLSPFNLIDYLWAVFRPDCRTLHDLAAGTIVVNS